MSFGVSGIRILSFASIIRHMTYCVKFFQYHVTQSISSPKSRLLRNASRQAKGKTKSGKNIASHTKRAVTKLSRILSQPLFLPILKCLLVHNKALYLTRSDLGISNTSIAFSAVHA